MDSINQVIKATHGDVLLGAVVMHVSPKDCFPLTKIRSLCRSGIGRLKSIFTRANSKRNGVHIGFVAGSDVSIVIEMTAELRPFLLTYLMQDEGMTREDAEVHADSKDKWYGVVDGRQVHSALLELGDELPSQWEKFKWPVLVLKSSPSIEVLRQIARLNNAKHSDRYYIQQTLFDIIYGAFKERKRLLAERGKIPNITDVAKAYDGVNHGKSVRSKTLCAATIASKLDESVISELGVIMNGEFPSLKSQSLSDQLTLEEVMMEEDCRVYREFISMNALRTASSFLDCSDEQKQNHQINALHRVKYLYFQNGFKKVTVQGRYKNVLDEQLSLSILASKEVHKFNEFLDSNEWPRQLKTTKDNLLRTTKFDDEIKKNTGNEETILQSLFDSYRQYFGSTFHIKLARYHHLLELKKSDQCTTGEGGPGTQDAAATTDGGSSEINSQVCPRNQHTCNNQPNTDTNCDQPAQFSKSAADIADTDHQRKLDYLREKNILPYCMTWELYHSAVHRAGELQVDLIITDPGCVQENATVGNTIVQAMFDDDSRRAFVRFCRDVLVPGGYVLVYGTVLDYIPWRDTFKKYLFTWQHYPCAIPVTENIQHRKVSNFPQNNMDLLYVARAPGDHPSGFSPDFRGQMQSMNGLRRFSCPGPTSGSTMKLTKPLSKAPLRVDERNIYVQRDQILLYTPPMGTVMDPLSGTMTAGMGAILSGRKAVLIEKDKTCFDAAVDRLHRFHHNENTEETPEPPAKRTRLSVSRSSVHADDAETNPGSSLYTPRTTCSSGSRSVEASENLSSDPANETINFRKRLDFENDASTGEHRSEDGSTDTQSSPDTITDYSTRFSQGEEVALLYGEKEIGTCTLQKPTDSDKTNYRRSSHNTDLTQYDSDGTYLVSVYNMKISEPFKSFDHPYPYFGNDDVPETLGDLYESSFYVWDLHALKSL